MDGVVVATPRTYGGDYFVGVNWLDDGLTRTRGEQQFYEDSHAFTQVAAVCLGAHALLLDCGVPAAAGPEQRVARGPVPLPLTWWTAHGSPSGAERGAGTT